MKIIMTAVLSIWIYLSAITAYAQYDRELAVPHALNLQIGENNTVYFPFAVRGAINKMGKWKKNVSTVTGTFGVTYKNQALVPATTWKRSTKPLLWAIRGNGKCKGLSRIRQRTHMI